MFARGEMKPVRFAAADVERHAVVRYRPGAALADPEALR
jgi:hypothetical protein